MIWLAVVGTLTNQIHSGMQRGYTAGVHGELPLATIDLVGDNREFESLRHILRSYTDYEWLIV